MHYTPTDVTRLYERSDSCSNYAVRTGIQLTFLRKVLRLCGEHVDALGAMLAALYGLPTVAYAFGRDQAIFFYVGREWAAGRLPYAEAFDIKPPGIYAAYAIAGQLFGNQLWSIRILELCGVLLLGFCAAHAVRRTETRVPGEVGAIMLLGSALYYTTFDYWDTGQVEFWEGLFALLGYLAAERVRDYRIAAVTSGLLGGLAVLFKTPVVLVLPVAGFLLLFRAYAAADGTWAQRAARVLLAFALHCVAGITPVALVVGYFALRGGLPALIELVGYTSTYVKNTQASAGHAKHVILLFWGHTMKAWGLLSLLGFTLGIALAARRRAWPVLRGATRAALLTLLAAASVAAQLKFWSYHWVVLTPFIVLCAAYGVSELARLRREVPIPYALSLVGIAFAFAPNWMTNGQVTYPIYVESFVEYVRGNIRRSEFLRPFVGVYSYDYQVQEQIGDAIGQLARPGDRLHVRGFEPAIYANARLASPSRFASEAPLRDPALTYKRREWAEEHERALHEHPPRFMVTFAGHTVDIAMLERRGYRRLGSLRQFVWLELPTPTAEPADDAASSRPFARPSAD